jgi:hypothetical protein
MASFNQRRFKEREFSSPKARSRKFREERAV